MKWVKRKIIAVLRACLKRLSADPDDKITRTPINQHTNTTDNSRPSNNTDSATSSADDALVESVTELADLLYQDLLYQDISLLTSQTMAAKAASHIDQGALQYVSGHFLRCI